MALTFTKVRKPFFRRPSGGLGAVSTFDVTFDSSYPTGGEPYTAANLNLLSTGKVIGMFNTCSNAAAAAYQPAFDCANAKILMYQGGTQVANATDLSAITIRVEVLHT